MIETFPCFECEASVEVSDLVPTIQTMKYDTENDELHAFANYHCPYCESVLLGSCEIAKLTSTQEQ